MGSELPVNTILTTLFQLSQSNPFAITLLYADIPSYYTLNATRRIFQQRKQETPDEGHEGIFKSNSILTATAEQVRNLFAIILTTCSPSNPNRL